MSSGEASQGLAFHFISGFHRIRFRGSRGLKTLIRTFKVVMIFSILRASGGDSGCFNKDICRIRIIHIYTIYFIFSACAPQRHPLAHTVRRLRLTGEEELSRVNKQPHAPRPRLLLVPEIYSSNVLAQLFGHPNPRISNLCGKSSFWRNSLSVVSLVAFADLISFHPQAGAPYCVRLNPPCCT